MGRRIFIIIMMSFLMLSNSQVTSAIYIDGEFSEWINYIPLVPTEEIQNQIDGDPTQIFFVISDSEFYFMYEYIDPWDWSMLGNITLTTSTEFKYLLMFQYMFDYEGAIRIILPGVDLFSQAQESDEFLFDEENGVFASLEEKKVEFSFPRSAFNLQDATQIHLAFWSIIGEPLAVKTNISLDANFRDPNPLPPSTNDPPSEAPPPNDTVINPIITTIVVNLAAPQSLVVLMLMTVTLSIFKRNAKTRSL